MKRKRIVIIIMAVILMAVYVSPVLAASKPDGKAMVRVLEPDKVTRKLLTNRRGNYLVVEVCYGKVTDNKGNGKVLNTSDKTYNYISYRGVKGAKKGKHVLTLIVYGNSNVVDDVAFRIDKVV